MRSDRSRRAASGHGGPARSASVRSRGAPPTRATRLGLALAVAAILAIAWRPARDHVRAASLLARFIDPESHRLLSDIGRHPITLRELASPGASRARLYVPERIARPPGLVLVHGVHYRGIDEPRLQRLARAIAEEGVAVLTPEIRALCEYRVDPGSIDAIGAAARTLARELGVPRVGVMGFSFAGGLSLIAASDPDAGAALSFVVAIGAHDDLGRVLRFFVDNESPRPDGTTLHLRAHPYGPAVLVSAHAADFCPAADAPLAAEVLRLWIHEDFGAARELARGLSPAGAAEMTPFFDRDTAPLAPAIAAEIDRLAPSFAAVSPSAHLARLRVPVFLLHGASDRVIPASETEWLAHDTPASRLRAVLVTRAIEHVELEGQAPLADRLALVHFMAGVLDALR
jgi:pimeloyl-ACP methyl ester carboxylesterase